jgi:gamma-glutamylcyclotransferase
MMPAAGGGAAHYFAYGSNLSSARLKRRVPSARVVCAATLADHRLSLGKAGRDGSGKATLVRASGALCWGVVYTLAEIEWSLLDACEPGYTRAQQVVTTVTRETLAVQTYVAPETARDPVATASYLGFILEGAREHRLPAAWIAQLATLPVRPDPAALR